MRLLGRGMRKRGSTYLAWSDFLRRRAVSVPPSPLDQREEKEEVRMICTLFFNHILRNSITFVQIQKFQLQSTLLSTSFSTPLSKEEEVFCCRSANRASIAIPALLELFLAKALEIHSPTFTNSSKAIPLLDPGTNKSSHICTPVGSRGVEEGGGRTPVG